MERFVKVIENTKGNVVKIKVKIKCKDSTGKIKLTDIMLQPGSMGSSWSGHPSEVRWSFNE